MKLSHIFVALALGASLMSCTPEEEVPASSGGSGGSGGSSSEQVTISYPTLKAYYEIDTPIQTVNASSNVGSSKLSNFSVSPNLPGGLFLNPDTGAISGTPVGEWLPEEFTITATGPDGVVSKRIVFGVHKIGETEVDPDSTDPRNYTYDRVVIDAYTNEDIQINTPRYFGDSMSFFFGNGAPYGININLTSGVMSGSTTYTGNFEIKVEMRADNYSPAHYTVVKLRVQEAPLTNLTYTPNPAIVARNDYMSLYADLDRGSPLSCSIAPALHTGLSFNTSTCAITGSVNTNQAPATYAITATNSVGTATTNLTIEIAERAPEGLTYTKGAPRYVEDVAIASNEPKLSYSGGVASSYSVSPALPTGLVLNTSTGIITGTPSNLQSSADYVVTATNSTGSTQATLSIAVVEPGTSTIYTADGAAIKAHSVDAINGDATYMGKQITSSVTSALLFHPSSDCAVGFSGGALESFEIDKSEGGELTRVSSVGGLSNPGAIAQTADGGSIFIANSGYISSYTLNSSCQATHVANAASTGAPKGLVVAGANVYVFNSAATIEHFRHNGSGNLVYTSSIGMQLHANPPSANLSLGDGLSLAVNSAGTYVYAFDTLKAIETFSVNASTGVLSSASVAVHQDRFYFRKAWVTGDFILHPYQTQSTDGIASLKMGPGYVTVAHLRQGQSEVGENFGGATAVSAHTSASGTYVYASYTNVARRGARRLKLSTPSGTMTAIDASLAEVVGGY